MVKEVDVLYDYELTDEAEYEEARERQERLQFVNIDYHLTLNS